MKADVMVAVVTMAGDATTAEDATVGDATTAAVAAANAAEAVGPRETGTSWVSFLANREE